MITLPAQDILVASSLSFGSSGGPASHSGLAPGTVMDADLDMVRGHYNEDRDHHSQDRGHHSEDSGYTGHFTPSELVSTSVSPVVTTRRPPLRRGTVEDVPAPRPTTERTEASSLGSSPAPAPAPATYRTSKLEPDYSSYLRNLVEEEPARSTEVVEPGTALSRYSGAGYSGYYPRPREPYPYKNLRMPLPYLAPPRHRAPARDRGDSGEFDREDMMGNKMDSTQHIEGYIDSDEAGYPANVYAAHAPPAVPSPAPALSALTPHQLATRLSLTTPRPGPEGGNTRDYTVFDMADAVVTVTAPPDNTLDEGADPRLSNHRPRFVTYSEAAPRRVRGPQSPVTADTEDSTDYSEQHNQIFLTPHLNIFPADTHRPDYGDQSPAPARTSEDRLLVEVTEGGARNVSVEDLLFLYNITFLTDSREIQPSSGARPILDHNLDLAPGSDEYDESVFDYSALPDYRDLDSEERFNEALEELLGDYEDYSQEQGGRTEEEVEVEQILSEIMGETSLSPSLLGEVLEGEGGRWQHSVNHRTHSVPEFANKLISEQRLISSQQPSTSQHHPSPDTVASTGAIKEVLMVLNATGKVGPANRTRDGGYYPEHEEEYQEYYYDDTTEEEYEASIGEIDDDIEHLAAAVSGHKLRVGGGELGVFGTSEADNGSNTTGYTAYTGDYSDYTDYTEGGDQDSTDAGHTSDQETAEEEEEKKYFYPVTDKDDLTATEDEESTAEVALDPRNLSDTILDSWDSHSDEILSNDQFKDELEKEKQEKAELQELLGTNRYELRTIYF